MPEIYGEALLSALQPHNLLFVFFGVFYGTLIGMLPGIGSVAGISLLLPLTYNMDPTSALIMLCGIFYGTEYGGSTTSILLRTPGEGASAIACIDGYQIAKKGRPKLALATAAVASFIAGIGSAIALALLTEPLSRIAIMMAPPEYCAVAFIALLLTATLSGKSMARGIAMLILGLGIATIGLDPPTSISRFTFDTLVLQDGVPFLIAATGLFAIPELMFQFNRGNSVAGRLSTKLGGWMTWPDFRRIVPAALRGSGLGFLLGIMPGAGGIAATFLAYGVERNVSKHPEEFGKGAIEGLAGPEAANNASSQGALLPLFTLGIPGSATAAILLGAFMMYGLQPGPTLMARNPEIVWTIITSMIVGNMMLLALNFPLVPLFAKILDLPRSILFGSVAVFLVTSVYTIRGDPMDLLLLIGFGLGGYLLKLAKYPLAPILMGMVLGDLLEESFRRSLSISLGDPAIFFTRPISASILAVGGLIISIKLYGVFNTRRRTTLGGVDNG